MSNHNPGISPAGHRILVWPIPVERTTTSGIIIPDESAKREDMAQIKAEVVAIGTGAFKTMPGYESDTAPWCQVGDVVLIAKFAGLYYNSKDGRSYRVINDSDVVAVIEEERNG
ncbi:MAG: hypothetical protein MN733_26240 [Nitrososphaera sp.]|nr:hypothetical protein [Nitrososphaera sp.]